MASHGEIPKTIRSRSNLVSSFSVKCRSFAQPLYKLALAAVLAVRSTAAIILCRRVPRFPLAARHSGITMAATLPVARASVPVVTDATSASEAELLEAASLYLSQADLTFERCGGGVNNKVYCVKGAAPADRWILRIYNNGFNTSRVRYEHEVLRLLAPHSLPYEVPTLLPPLLPGKTSLASGAEACLFRHISGGPAGLTAARSLGASTAALVAAMGSMRVDASLGHPNPLYRNIWEAHHKISAPLFYELVSTHPDFDAVRTDMDYLVAEIRAAESLIARLLADGGLPEQQVNDCLTTRSPD